MKAYNQKRKGLFDKNMETQIASNSGMTHVKNSTDIISSSLVSQM